MRERGAHGPTLILSLKNEKLNIQKPKWTSGLKRVVLDRKGLMGWFCLSDCLSVWMDGCMSRSYCSTCETMSKGNKGNRLEGKLEAQEKQAALYISF
jgi:hypothetical protein